MWGYKPSQPSPDPPPAAPPPEAHVGRCIFCGEYPNSDDVELRHERTGRVVCLRCFKREVGDAATMPKDYQRDVIDAAGQLPEQRTTL